MFNKILKNALKDLEGDRTIKCINNFLNTLLIILVVLLAIVIGTIFNIEFEHGIFDTKVIIDIVPNLLSGYLGFLGAIVGVMGAFFMYQYQSAKEKKEKAEMACKNIYEMINNSVQRTQEATVYIVKRYCQLIDNYDIDVLTKDIDKDLDYIYKHNFCIEIEGMNADERGVIQRFKNDINTYLRTKDFSYLIYNKNWYSYLEIFSEGFVSETTEWVNILLSKEYVNNAYSFLISRWLVIDRIEQMDRSGDIKGAYKTVSKRVHSFRTIYKERRF